MFADCPAKWPTAARHAIQRDFLRKLPPVHQTAAVGQSQQKEQTAPPTATAAAAGSAQHYVHKRCQPAKNHLAATGKLQRLTN